MSHQELGLTLGHPTPRNTGRANFYYDSVHSQLDITLTNTGSAAGNNPDVLLGLFFNASGSSLTAVSASLTGVSNLINLKGAPVSGNAADGWAYDLGSSVQSATSGTYPVTDYYAIHGAGYTLTGNQSNFPNHTSNINIDGVDYGIVNGVSSGTKVNKSPLVDNSMTFVMGGYTGQSITDVVVQYGTGIGPNEKAPFIPLPVNAVPEPSTMVIAALGTLGFLGYGLRKRMAK